MARKPFRDTPSKEGIGYQAQGVKDLTGSILQTGQSSARAISSVGQGIATAADVYVRDRQEKKAKEQSVGSLFQQEMRLSTERVGIQEQQDLDENDWLYATNENDNDLNDTIRQVRTAPNLNTAKEIAQGFKDRLRAYPNTTNPSGVKALQSELTRSKFTKEYTPKAVAAIEDELNAKVSAVQTSDRIAKYNVQVKDMISRAETPLDVDRSKDRMKALVYANESAAQAPIIYKQKVEEMTINSLQSGIDTFVGGDEFTYDEAEAHADVVAGDILEADIPAESRKALNEYSKGILRRKKIVEQGKKVAIESTTKDMLEGQENTIYGGLNSLMKEPGKAATLGPQIQDQIDASDLPEKKKLSLSKQLNLAMQFESQPSDKGAIRVLDGLSGAIDTPTSDLISQLDTYIDGGKINLEDAIKYRTKFNTRLGEQGKRVMEQFMYDTLDEPLITGKEIGLSGKGIETEDFIKKSEEYKIYKAQLQAFGKEALEANPHYKAEDLKNIFATNVQRLKNLKGQVQMTDLLDTYKRRADVEEDLRLKGEEKAREEIRLFEAKRISENLSSEELRRFNVQSRRYMIQQATRLATQRTTGKPTTPGKK